MKNIIQRPALITGILILLVAGSLGAPADYDPTFGNNGKTVTTMGAGNSFILASALQADGKILVVGAVANNGTDFTLARYNKDGSLDLSFDGDGYVYTDFGSPSDSSRAIAIQPDGKILVAGSTIVGNRADFAIARYNAEGGLDSSFGSGGKVITSVDQWGDVAHTITLLLDGRILVAGYSEDGSFDERFGVVRYNPNGTLDNSFGTDGKTTVSVGANSQGVKKAFILGDGKIMLIGSGAMGATGTDFVLVRLNANGVIDNSFDTDGRLATSISVTDIANSAAIQPDGKIVVVGYTDDANSSCKFAAVRYHPNGVKDNDFGFFGIYTAQIGANFEDAASAVAIQPDGKIIIAGQTKIGFENYDLALARITPSGGADNTFGTAGKVIIPVSNKDDSVNSMLLQPNGRIVLAGASLDPLQRFSFTLVRLLGRHTRGDYDSDGKSDIGVYRPSTGTWWLNRSQTGVIAYNFGLNGDKPVVGDYDGDGRNDLAVFRPSNRVWYLQQTSNGFSAAQFGLSDDIPAPADYDGDGKTDIAVFRPSNGVWHIQRSQLGYTSYPFGLQGDLPVSGDFDRDGKADAAVFRPSNGVWYVLGSRNGFFSAQFGASGDIPVNGDFDGDLANDLVVYRPSTGMWYILRSSDSQAQVVQFGINGDIPAAADFDGDGLTDRVVYRPSNGTWYFLRSSDGQSSAQMFGLNGDVPVASVLAQ